MTCSLCDLPADPPVTDEGVDGQFCCRGCLEISRSLDDIDPGEIETSRPTESTHEDAETTYLAVDGMHCSTCELFLEDLACQQPGVFDADASYAAETVKLTYDADAHTQSDLADAVSGLGYSARARGETGEDETDLASRLLVGGLFSMMAMTWYGIFLYPAYFGFDPIVDLGTFDGAYVSGQLAVVTAIVLLYTGRPMLRGAFVSLRTGRPNVDLLVSVAAVAAYAYSTAQLAVGGTHLYYDVTIVVVMAVTIGNYYETRIKRRTAGLLSELTELRVEEATTEDGETVPVEDVTAGERLLVRPGERVPVDGTVAEGTAAVDEALVTGESVPETKGPGDSVRGGTIVTDDPLVVEAGTGAESTLDRLVGTLWEIQATRPGPQRVADRIATVFVPLVLGLAVAGGVLALVLGGSAQTGLLVGLTVVIVSCPCALGLATPLAVATGLQAAADRGIVVAAADLFEQAPEVETVVFDKTGTLSTGEMSVTTVEATASRSALLDRAAALERYSSHPIAAAITEAADADTTAAEVSEHTKGVSGVVDGTETLVGHPALFEERGWSVPGDISRDADAIRDRGDVAVLIGWDGTARGVVGVGDRLREETPAVLDELGAHRLVVLTGDDRPATEALGAHPAVDTAYTGVPPDGKTETIRRLAAEGPVAMVGDGSNDAPALAAADVGIALDGGTELATDAADAVILDDDLRNVPEVFEAAARTNRRIKQNIVWAFCYNGLAVPLALTGVLNPLLAAVAMASSSLFVVANSARGYDDQEPDLDEADRTGGLLGRPRGA